MAAATQPGAVCVHRVAPRAKDAAQPAPCRKSACCALKGVLAARSPAAHLRRPPVAVQLGPDNLSNLKEIASQYKGDEDAEGGEGGDDDDDVPDLVDTETFDESA